MRRGLMLLVMLLALTGTARAQNPIHADYRVGVAPTHQGNVSPLSQQALVFKLRLQNLGAETLQVTGMTFTTQGTAAATLGFSGDGAVLSSGEEELGSIANHPTERRLAFSFDPLEVMPGAIREFQLDVTLDGTTDLGKTLQWVIAEEADLVISPVGGPTDLQPARSSFPVEGPIWVMAPEPASVQRVSTTGGEELGAIFAAGIERSEAIRFDVIGAQEEAVNLHSFEFSFSDPEVAGDLLVLAGTELLKLQGPDNDQLPSGNEPVVGTGASWVGEGTARMDLDPPLVIEADEIVTLLLSAEFGIDESFYDERYRFLLDPSSFHLSTTVTGVDPLEVTGDTIFGRTKDYRPVSSGLSPTTIGLDTDLTAGQTDRRVMAVTVGYGTVPYTKVIDAIEVSTSGSTLNPSSALRNIRLWELKHNGVDYVFNREVDGVRDPQIEPGPWAFQLEPDVYEQSGFFRYVLVMDFTASIPIQTRLTTTMKSVGGHIMRQDGLLAPMEHDEPSRSQDVRALSEIPPARLTMVSQSSPTTALPRTAPEAKRIWTFAARSQTEAQLLESVTVRVQSTFNRAQYLERVELWRDDTNGSDPLGSNPASQTYLGAIEGLDVQDAQWTFAVDPESTPVLFTDTGSTSSRTVRFVLSATLKDAPQDVYGETITFSMEQASDIVTRGVEWDAIAEVLSLPLSTIATITPPRVTIQAGPAYPPGSQLTFCGVPYSADFLHIRVTNGPAEQVAWSSIGIQDTSPGGPQYFADSITGIYIYGDQGNNGRFTVSDTLMSPFESETNRFDETGLVVFDPSEEVLNLNPEISSGQYIRAFPPAGVTLTYVVGATFDNPLPLPGEERVFTGAVVPELIGFVGMDSGDPAEVTIESLPLSREVLPGPGSLTIRNLLTNPPSSPSFATPGQELAQGFQFEIEMIDVQNVNVEVLEFEAVVIDSDLDASEVLRTGALLTVQDAISFPPPAGCTTVNIPGTLNPATSRIEFEPSDLSTISQQLSCGDSSRAKILTLRVGIQTQAPLDTRISIRLAESGDLVVSGGCLDIAGDSLPTTVVDGFPMVGRDLLVTPPLMILDKPSNWPRNPPSPPTAELEPLVVFGGTPSWMLGNLVTRRGNTTETLTLDHLAVHIESEVDLAQMIEVDGGLQLVRNTSVIGVGNWDPATKMATFENLNSAYTSTGSSQLLIVATPTSASRHGMHIGEQIQLTIPEGGLTFSGEEMPDGITEFLIRDWQSPSAYKDSLPFHFPPADIRFGSARVTQEGANESHVMERGTRDLNMLAFRIARDDTESIVPESLWIQLNGDFPADGFTNRQVRLYRMSISDPGGPFLHEHADYLATGLIDPATGRARITWPAWETVSVSTGTRYMVVADIAPGAPGGQPFRFTLDEPEDIVIRGSISTLEVPTSLLGTGPAGLTDRVFGFTYTIPEWEIDRVWIE